MKKENIADSLRLSPEDVHPVTEFRNNASDMIAYVRKSKRPMILTQRGRGSVVLMDAKSYERILAELDLLKDASLSEAELEAEAASYKRQKKKTPEKSETEYFLPENEGVEV